MKDLENLFTGMNIKQKRSKKADNNLTRFYLYVSSKGVTVLPFDNTNLSDGNGSTYRIKRDSHRKFSFYE